MTDNNPKVEGIYVVHAKYGYEGHGKRVEKLFKAMNLGFEFVSEGDISNFSDDFLGQYFCKDVRKLYRDGSISVTLNHFLCYEKVVANRNKYALIFEDDPFFLGDFHKKIAAILTEASTLPPNFIVSLENTSLEFPSWWKSKKNKLLYEARKGRCAGAYLLDLAAATTMLHVLKTERSCDVIDWWHNTLIEEGRIKMYWAQPALVEQGSHNGLMSSTISTEKKNWKRRVSWLVQKFYKTYIYTFFHFN